MLLGIDRVLSWCIDALLSAILVFFVSNGNKRFHCVDADVKINYFECENLYVEFIRTICNVWNICMSSMCELFVTCGLFVCRVCADYLWC